jgi:hypothetical protein
MNSKIDMLCIDGVTAVGKTSQIWLYRNFLRKELRDYKIFELTEVDNPQETKEKLLKITQYLRENPNSTALCDGSMATDIADDMANNMLSEDIWEKHQQNLQIYASMSQEFKITNILLAPTDLRMCNKRLEKKKIIFNIESSDIENIEHLRRTVNVLRNFDDNTLTTNIRFYTIDVDTNDSMLDIHEKIKKITLKA